MQDFYKTQQQNSQPFFIQQNPDPAKLEAENMKAFFDSLIKTYISNHILYTFK